MSIKRNDFCHIPGPLKSLTECENWTLDQCMDVLDWFDDPLYEYMYDILVSKLDADARVKRTFVGLVAHVERLMSKHQGMENEYPMVFRSQLA